MRLYFTVYTRKYIVQVYPSAFYRLVAKSDRKFLTEKEICFRRFALCPSDFSHYKSTQSSSYSKHCIHNAHIAGMHLVELVTSQEQADKEGTRKLVL